MGQLDLFGFEKKPEPSEKKKAKPRATPDAATGDVFKTAVEKESSENSSLFVETDIDAGSVVDSPVNKDDGASDIRPMEAETQIDEYAEVQLQAHEIIEDATDDSISFAAEEGIARDDNETTAYETSVLQHAIENVGEFIINEVIETVPNVRDINTNPVVFTDGKIGVKFKEKQLEPVPVNDKVEQIEEKLITVKSIAQKRGRKSLKEIDAQVDLIEVPEDEILFQKQYYAISTVAAWFKVNTSLLRYWENEFDILKPRKNRKGDRMFRPEDVKNLQLIYHLLRQRKYTIDGAKECIRTNKKKADTELQLTQTLQKFKSFLLELKTNLQP